jgi:hypothetical protein
MTPATVRDAAELQELFERFASLSSHAIAACEAGDDAALASVLDARDIVASRASELTRAFALARRTATSRSALDTLDLALRPVRLAAATAESANGALMARARAVRTTLGEQLDRLRHDESARSAYTDAATPGERTFLDVTR